jgi:integrase/recombinase XerD
VRGSLAPQAIQHHTRHNPALDILGQGSDAAVSLAALIAAQRAICPDLASKHVTVHTLRHTAAMRFLEAGIDAAVIALWLGHESQATTSIYLHADIALKRKALERTRQPDTRAGEYQPAEPLLAWLQSL